MKPAIPDPRVHLGLHACQGPEEFLWHGLGRYVRDHAFHLIQNHGELIAGLHVDRDLPVPRTLGDFSGFGLLYQNQSGNGQPNGALDADIFHAMSPLWPTIPLHRLIPGAMVRAGAKIVVTLYDLIPLVYRDWYLRDPAHKRWFHSRLNLIKDADHVLALSATTRDDAVRLLGLDPNRITVIYGGVSDFFREAGAPVEAVRRQVMSQLPAIRGPYVVHPAGAAQYRKNITGAIDSLARLPPQLRDGLQLVVLGFLPASDVTALQERARSQGLADHLVLPGFVSDDLLRQLYQACELCLFPSLYEGFGLPILEAMRCGAPVVTSDRSSTKELVELPEALFNPEDPSDIARVVARVLTDGSLRLRLKEYGLQRNREFTWDRVARATADSYRELAGRRGRPAQRIEASGTPRLTRGMRGGGADGSTPKVHISLQPCQGSDGQLWQGVGRVAWELTAQLLRNHREIIAGLHLDPALPVPRSLSVSGQDLLKHPRSEAFLNVSRPNVIFHVVSPFWPVVPLHRLIPPPFMRGGVKVVVTLHDLIPLIYKDAYLTNPSDRQWFFRRLRLLEEADHVVAVSRATRNDAIRLLGLSPDRVSVVYNGVSNFFRPCETAREVSLAAVSHRIPAIDGQYLFYPAGTGQFRKNVNRLIEAYGRLPSSLQQRLQLVISGHMLDQERTTFAESAQRLGLDGRLVLTGFVDDETLRELYQGADLCLYPSLYEGFGLPILEAMRCRTPVITSDCSSMKELLEIDEARFDPEDTNDIACAIERVLSDASLARRLVSYGAQRSKAFTWKTAADQIVEVYRRVAMAETPQALLPR